MLCESKSHPLHTPTCRDGHIAPPNSVKHRATFPGAHAYNVADPNHRAPPSPLLTPPDLTDLNHPHIRRPISLSLPCPPLPSPPLAFYSPVFVNRLSSRPGRNSRVSISLNCQIQSMLRRLLTGRSCPYLLRHPGCGLESPISQFPFRRGVPGPTGWTNRNVAARTVPGLCSRRPFFAAARRNDTIYALSTAQGKAGIAVIRVSGALCQEVISATPYDPGKS